MLETEVVVFGLNWQVATCNFRKSIFDSRRRADQLTGQEHFSGTDGRKLVILGENPGDENH